MLCKVTPCVGHALANFRPHWLCWADLKMETAISCTNAVWWLAFSILQVEASRM